MKNKLLFNLLTPFATSNTEGKTFRNLLALVMVVVGMNGVVGQSTCLSQLNFTETPTNWAATSITYLSNEANFASNNGELTTLALSNPTSLVFDLRRSSNATAKTLFVEVSTTTQGGVYTTVGTYTHSNTISSATTTITLDLSAYSSNNTVFIKFRKSSATTSPWFLKNVVVSCASCTTPDTVTSLAASVAFNQSNVTWTNGACYDEMMLVVSSASFSVATPTGNGSSYTANSLSFTDGSNTTFDGGKVVYKGTGTSATVTSLTNGTPYNYKIFTRKGTTWTSGTVATATPGTVPVIIYQNPFENGTLSSPTYTGGTTTLATNLSNSVWTIGVGTLALYGGNGGGNALGVSSGASSTPYTLTFSVANGYQLSVNSYSFWKQTSSSAVVNSVTINGITVSSGAASSSTGSTGTLTVANSVSGLTGTITVVLNITGSGSFRLDDFTLNGNVLLATNNWTGGTGNWNTPANWSLSQVPLTTDNITISSGSPVMDVNHTVAAGRTLTISGTGSLTINPSSSLTIAGDVDFGGKLVTIKSTSAGSGSIGQISGTLTGATNVTVERYIPARRAFRFLSPSVTTSTSIKLNWQENAGTTAGLGTHITGVDGATNGFDATATNNPSLFTFNNSTGVWEAVTSTLTNSLTAGIPYRLMVRGDRLTVLTTNTPTATPTVLRATGTLHTGNFSPTLNQTAEGFSFVGNPYQATVDIKAVLNAATNMNNGVVYYWDPTLNARGGYVTRDLTANNNNVTSDFNQYLQPGQAVFVKKANTTVAASMTFTESNKSVANAAPGVFRTANTSAYGLLRVNLQANTNNQWATIEGTLALFNDNYSWNVTSEDATKMVNLDEEVSFVQNNTNLAIALQNNPSATSELPIKIDKMRHANYLWQFELDNYNGATPYLFDTLNNSYTQINNGTVVPFTADSTTTNRFKIVFQNAVLSNATFQNTLAIYPNPAKAGASFYVDGITEATVTVSNLLGQNVPVETKTQGNTLQVIPTSSLSQGVYLVNITTQGSTQQVKWIVE